MSSLEKTNCLFLSTETEPESGGVGYYNDTLINGLEKYLSYRVFTYAENNKNLRANGGFHLPFKNKNLIFKVLNAIWLSLKFSTTSFDKIICAHVFLLPIALIFAALRGKKISLVVYGIDCWGGRLERYKNYYDKIEAIIAISSFTKEELVKQGYPQERVIMVPPLVEFDIDHIEKENEIEQGQFNLLTVGRMAQNEAYKGHRVILKALAEIKDQLDSFHYHIAGSGDDLENLKNFADELGLTPFVTFYGFVSDEDLDALYRKCNLFLMPSEVSTDINDLKGEGFGIVFVEAAKYKLASIGADTGGSIDIVIDGQTGLTVNPTDHHLLAEKILKLSREPEKTLEYGEIIHQHCLKNFSMNLLEKYLNQLK